MNRIRTLRTAAGMKQAELATQLHVSQAALSGYENGKFEATNDVYRKIAEIFGVTLDYLMGTAPISVKMDPVRIPVVGMVAAGYPHFADEEILDFEEVSPELAARGELFGLRVTGQSMEPMIMDGDIAIVRRQDDAENGDTVVAKVNGDEATVKKLRRSTDMLTLVPINPTFEPLFYTPQQVEELPVRIIGKVVEIRRKL